MTHRDRAMTDWRDLKVEGLTVRERIAAVFQVSDSLSRLPFAKFSIARPAILRSRRRISAAVSTGQYKTLDELA
jgi:hypothetical protein